MLHLCDQDRASAGVEDVRESLGDDGRLSSVGLGPLMPGANGIAEDDQKLIAKAYERSQPTSLAPWIPRGPGVTQALDSGPAPLRRIGCRRGVAHVRHGGWETELDSTPNRVSDERTTGNTAHETAATGEARGAGRWSLVREAALDHGAHEPETLPGDVARNRQRIDRHVPRTPSARGARTGSHERARRTCNFEKAYRGRSATELNRPEDVTSLRFRTAKPPRVWLRAGAAGRRVRCRNPGRGRWAQAGPCPGRPRYRCSPSGLGSRGPARAADDQHAPTGQGDEQAVLGDRARASRCAGPRIEELEAVRLA